MKHVLHTENVHQGFQMAPMIDVVFVIMLFFMMMTATVKSEAEMGLVLPGKGNSLAVDEMFISIDEEGYVYLNEDEIGAPSDQKLAALTLAMTRLKADDEGRGGDSLINVETEDTTRYQRLVDVINVLKRTGHQKIILSSASGVES